MKKLLVVTGILAISAAIISCGGGEGDDTGRDYMPDMKGRRAFETYGYNSHEAYQHLKDSGINYTAMPVPGTMARGDMEAYPYPNSDTGYAQSVAFRNPFDTVTFSPAVMKEAERLYLINCGICHGSKLDGNGPLWKDGTGPYPVLPRPLNGDYVKKLADGQIYHVITYGRGQMGSYASQVHPEQRWWLVKYIRSKQSPSDTTAAPKTDSTAVASK